VDVFFVVSAFFITKTLISQIGERLRRIQHLQLGATPPLDLDIDAPDCVAPKQGGRSLVRKAPDHRSSVSLSGTKINDKAYCLAIRLRSRD